MNQFVNSIRLSMLMCVLGCFSLLACHSKRYMEGVSERMTAPVVNELPHKHQKGFAEPIRLTAGNESSFSADISPNGRYVVMTSDRYANKDIWEKELNGKPARQLTFHAADDFNPSISPNGKYIAF